MAENKTISCSPRDQTKKDNATSQALVVFSAPKEGVEIFHESKMTNTEEVTKSIYFGYPCRRHSCSLVNIPAPCVNKMISHIGGVESKIQEHLKQFETSFEEWSRTSARDLKDWSIATPIKEVKPTEERDEKCPELKQEMERLLSEAIYLIKSLETDRAEAEKALKQQKSRRIMVKTSIDFWAMWRFQEIPLAVQREHETYLRDIIELRWHLKDRSHELTGSEEEKTKWENANAKVQVDVDYMKERSFQLNSKLAQELEALKECYQKKDEVMEQYKQVHEELVKTIENNENTKLRAKQLREEMENDLLNDKACVETCRKEIDSLGTLDRHYSTLIQNVNISIVKNEEAMTDVLKETKTSKDELDALSKTLNDLKRVYDKLVSKKEHDQNIYLEAFNEFYLTKKLWEIDLSNITKDFSDLSLASTQLKEENKRIEKDMETIRSSIKDSIRKKSELETELQSLIKLKSKNEEYLKQLFKDAYHIGAIFHLTRYKTEDLEEQISEVKRKFKGRENFLRRLIRAEVAHGMGIQKKLYSIQEEQALEMQELIRRKALYTLILAEIQLPLLEIEQEAVRIQTVHGEQSDILNHIIEKRDNIKSNVEKTKKKLQRKGKKTQEALIETERKHSLVINKIETTKSRTLIYQEKVKQLQKDIEDKHKEKEIFDQTLDILKEQFLDVRFKNKHVQAVYDHLIDEQKACQERLFEEEQRYRTLLAMRQKTLADTKKIQDDSLEENLRLAQEYQKLQVIFLTKKDNYFSLYDGDLLLAASVRDKKQLCQLQRRIHKLWQKYFKLVVLYTRVRLAKFQTDSQESIQKILAVQEESSNLMHRIVDFFQTLPDSRCKNDDEANNQNILDA
ncbi:coiled-coil domain-containing protein 178 [Saccopteryx bilineata]|uniref:coiled-coil domain-containing protein 178 n=1 Tax=Saccopteryx bilineata TaxID=59482 RepID=UPI00338EEB85